MSSDGLTRRGRRTVAGLPNISEAKRRRLHALWEQRESKRWIQKAIKDPGALHRHFGIPEGEDIPTGKIKKELAKLKIKKGDLTAAEKKLQKQLQLALTLRGPKVPPPKGKQESVEITERWRGGKVERSTAGRSFGRDVVLITAEQLDTFNVHDRGDPEALGCVQRTRDPRTLKILPREGWGAQVCDKGTTITLKGIYPTREKAIQGVLEYWQEKG